MIKKIECCDGFFASTFTKKNIYIYLINYIKKNQLNNEINRKLWKRNAHWLMKSMLVYLLNMSVSL